MSKVENLIQFLMEVKATESSMKQQSGKIIRFSKDDTQFIVKIYKEHAKAKILKGKIYVDDEAVYSISAYNNSKDGAIESVSGAILDALKIIINKTETKKEVKKDEVKKVKEEKVSQEYKANKEAMLVIAEGMDTIKKQIDEISKMFDNVAKGYIELKETVSKLK